MSLLLELAESCGVGEIIVTACTVPQARRIPSMVGRDGQFLLAIDSCLEMESQYSLRVQP